MQLNGADAVTNDMWKELRAIVHGRVQLVMYRDFATRTARRFGIVGHVRNLQDGTVEVVAQGGPAALAAYLSQLRRGSLFAQVRQVDVSWGVPTERSSNFEIRY